MPSAIARLEELLESDQDGVVLAAVKDVLDRNGYKPKEQVDINAQVTSYDPAAWSRLTDEEVQIFTAICAKLAKPVEDLEVIPPPSEKP
ncbi:MAG: hypothetical protein LLG20_18840 [Acidobacteriales bacterium]|nr:hypothetical protein [Terriglobales bacterium]